jgi:hypothetical protein
MEKADEIMNASYQDTEVSKMEWKTAEQCMQYIRPYNLEKKEVLNRVEKTLSAYTLYDIM